MQPQVINLALKKSKVLFNGIGQFFLAKYSSVYKFTCIPEPKTIEYQTRRLPTGKSKIFKRDNTTEAVKNCKNWTGRNRPKTFVRIHSCVTADMMKTVSFANSLFLGITYSYMSR